MRFARVCQTYRAIEQVSSRNEKVSEFTSLLASLNSEQQKHLVKATLCMFKPRYEEDFDLMVAKSLTQQCLLKCFPQTTEL